MKWILRSVLLLAFVAIASQDITGKKRCDCSICKGVDNKISPIVGKKIGDDGSGKSGCSICEKKKEMLRLEREKQRQLQKCPFEILGSPSMKGKTSEEIFDEFRELIVPSQNGFFDMMRGIVRTMHVSSVAELKWAKEKEARELAKKKKEEAEEARKRKEHPPEEIVGLNNQEDPKVTVVLKQTPCGQVIQTNERDMPEKIYLTKRLPKETDNDDVFRIPEEEFLSLQSVDPADDQSADYLDLNSKENLLHSDLIEQLMSYKTTVSPTQEKDTTNGEDFEDNSEEKLPTFGEDSNPLESTTESPYVKFISNDEMKALSGGKNSLDDFDMGLNMLPTSFGSDRINKQNAQDIDYTALP